MQNHQHHLRVALWVAIGALLLAILPIWPYGFHTLLRLGISTVGIYGIYVLRDTGPKNAIPLACITLLFNPVIPVYLSKLLWVPIDLAVAFFFWHIIKYYVSGSSDSSAHDEGHGPTIF
jgi:hypothetical protein